MSSALPQIAIVVPCYNEEAALPESAGRLIGLLGELVAAGRAAPESSIHFVDDGSSDPTWSLIEKLAARHPQCHGIKLSRNHGHQHALLAGLLTAPGDALISIDADLQDDPAALPVGGSEILTELLDGGRTWGTWQARQDAASVVV